MVPLKQNNCMVGFHLLYLFVATIAGAFIDLLCKGSKRIRSILGTTEPKVHEIVKNHAVGPLSKKSWIALIHGCGNLGTWSLLQTNVIIYSKVQLTFKHLSIPTRQNWWNHSTIASKISKRDAKVMRHVYDFPYFDLSNRHLANGSTRLIVSLFIAIIQGQVATSELFCQTLIQKRQTYVHSDQISDLDLIQFVHLILVHCFLLLFTNWPDFGVLRLPTLSLFSRSWAYKRT